MRITPTRPRRAGLLHPDEAPVQAHLSAALTRGTRSHYTDAERYDHEYRGRRDDLAFYLRVAAEHRGPLLELGCGSGRLSLPLLRAGHELVGVDASASMLRRAEARIARLKPELQAKAELHRADFRALASPRSPLGRRRFPLVLCPFNAFQHLYDREDVERFLDGVRAHLSPKGLFVFDVMNPDLRWLSRDPTKRWSRTRYRDPKTGAPMTYSTEIAYDAPLQIAFMRIFHEPASGRGKRRLEFLTHRHFYPRELEALLHYNGFQIVRRDGDFEGGALSAESEQQVLWCRPAGADRGRGRKPRMPRSTAK